MIRLRLDRKLLNRANIGGALAFWTVGVIGNHGLGKITVHSPLVTIGEVGFISCWFIAIATSIVTWARHRAAYKRLGARAVRYQRLQRSRHKTFRLTR